MSDVKRYELTGQRFNNQRGSYVLYSDYAELEKQNARLTAERDAALRECERLPAQFREQCGDHCNNWCWHEQAAEFVESIIANRSKPQKEEQECGKCGGTGEICHSSTHYESCPECRKKEEL